MATSDEIDMKVLGPLSVTYPNHWRQFSASDTILSRSIYQRILADIDVRLLDAAVTQWISAAHPFNPSPGELRDLALSMVSRDEPTPDAAWSEVLNAVEKIGSYRTPQWSHERIAKTMQAFGRWSDFCLMETDQVPIVRAQFMKIYAVQMEREHDERLMLPETKAKVDALIGQTVKRLSGGHS